MEPRGAQAPHRSSHGRADSRPRAHTTPRGPNTSLDPSAGLIRQPTQRGPWATGAGTPHHSRAGGEGLREGPATSPPARCTTAPPHVPEARAVGSAAARHPPSANLATDRAHRLALGEQLAPRQHRPLHRHIPKLTEVFAKENALCSRCSATQQTNRERPGQRAGASMAEYEANT